MSMDAAFFTDGIIPYHDSLRKMISGLLIATLCTVLSCTATFAYGLFANSTDLAAIYGPSLLPYRVPNSNVEGLDYLVEVIVLIILIWNTSVSMLFVSFYSIICYILYKEFEYLGRTFEMKIAADGTFNDDMDRFRITHQNRYIIKYIKHTDPNC